MGALIDGLSAERRSDLLFIDDSKVKFRDSGTYIQSNTAGEIDITGQPVFNLPTTDTNSFLTVKDSETFPVFKIDGKGNVKAKGGVSKI